MGTHSESYDVIVVGGGHAGAKPRWPPRASARSTLLLTQSIETIGQMSCNPAIGGIGKSHLVREIDALDGAMARATDRAGIQFRVLNASKGPAVRATRAQADRVLYRQAMRQIVESTANLRVFQQSVVDLVVEGDRVRGVVTQSGSRSLAGAVVSDHRHHSSVDASTSGWKIIRADAPATRRRMRSRSDCGRCRFGSIG